MKIKFLGTAAYEGVPSLFCTCRVCQKAMKEGGRELRSRSQAIINDELLLDFPPDTVWHFQRFGLDWAKIGDCLITHDYSDHLYPEGALRQEREANIPYCRCAPIMRRRHRRSFILFRAKASGCFMRMTQASFMKIRGRA